MNAKHTPGPWHVNAIKGGRIVGDSSAPAGQYDKLMISNHNATVATVYRPVDARLIAKAPELVECLREVIKEYVSSAHADEEYFEGCQACKAVALLAEIEGKNDEDDNDDGPYDPTRAGGLFEPLDDQS